MTETEQERTRTPSVRVPEHSVAILDKLASLPASKVTKLSDALETASPQSAQAFSKLLHSQLEDLWDVRSIESLADELVTIGSVLSAKSITVDQLAADIANSNALESGPEARANLEALLRLILSSRGVSGLGGAFEAYMAQDRFFQHARIVVDLRPIFPSVAGEPMSAVIARKLRIIYHEYGNTKTFEVALDAEDVSVLQGALDRADEERAAIGAAMERAGVTLIDMDPREDSDE